MARLLVVLLIAGLIAPLSGQSSPNDQKSQSEMQRQPLRVTPSCERLGSLTLPNATITLARAVEAGAFTPPTPAGGAAPPPPQHRRSPSLRSAAWPQR